MFLINIVNGYVFHLAVLYFKGLIFEEKTSNKALILSITGGIFEAFTWRDPILKLISLFCILAIECFLISYKENIINNFIYITAIIIVDCILSCVFSTEYQKNFCISVLIITIYIIFYIIKSLCGRVRIDWITIKTYRGFKKLRIFADTGNLLKYKNLPVVVIRVEDILEIAPKNILNILGYCADNDDTLVYPMSYKTIMGEGILYCFLPDECIIGNKKIKCMIATTKGCSYFNGDCSALCNPNVMEG